jgi:FtsZ-binding cell division protein ZapB
MSIHIIKKMKRKVREYIPTIKLQQMYIENNDAHNEEWGPSKPQTVHSRTNQLEELKIASYINEINWYKASTSLLETKSFNKVLKLEIEFPFRLPNEVYLYNKRCNHKPRKTLCNNYITTRS